jgi:ribose transport system permease protein
MIALSGAIFAWLYVDGYPVLISLAATIVAGVALGCVLHGLVVTRLGVSFLIVTLGTFAIFRSLADVILNGQSITVYDETLDWLANGRIGPIPVLVCQTAIIYVVLLLLLRTTTFGSALYAVGANPEAARVAGLPVERVLMIAFGICAGLAAYAGIMTVAQLGSAQPTAGIGVELTAIGGVLVGGTSFAGGQGGVTRTVIGVLFLAILANLLLLIGVNSFWLGTASGIVLICAVALDRSRDRG